MENGSDTDNNNGPTLTFYSNNKPSNVIPRDSTSTSSSSKLNHSVAHSKIPRKKPVAPAKNVPFTMVKSKSDLNTLKTYPDSFTIITSPKRSPSAGYDKNKRRKNGDDDDDSLMDCEWIKPPPEMLYEAANAGDKYLEEQTYVIDQFGKKVSVPTSPIVTDKIMVGSSHR